MLEIDQDGQRILDDLVRLAALDVGDEADAAGILVERRVVEAARRRQAGIGGIGKIGGAQGAPLLLVIPVHGTHSGLTPRHPISSVPGAFASALRAMRWTGNLCSGGSRCRHAESACLCRLLFQVGGCRCRAAPHAPGSAGGSKDPAASTSNWDSNAVLSSTCQISKAPTRGGTRRSLAFFQVLFFPPGAFRTSGFLRLPRSIFAPAGAIACGRTLGGFPREFRQRQYRSHRTRHPVGAEPRQ